MVRGILLQHSCLTHRCFQSDRNGATKYYVLRWIDLQDLYFGARWVDEHDAKDFSSHLSPIFPPRAVMRVSIRFCVAQLKRQREVADRGA